MSGYPASQPFHLAFPAHDLAAARGFYGGLLGCPEGRSSSDWVDFDLFGHQIVAHLAPDEVGHRATSEVDGDAVPVRHFRRCPGHADVGGTGRTPQAGRHEVRNRAARPLQGGGG